MARTTRTIVETTVTDDVTGMVYSNPDGVSKISRYRVTIVEIDEKGDEVKGGTVMAGDIDTHVSVMNAVEGMLTGRMLAMIEFILAWAFGTDNNRAASLLGYLADNGATDAVIKAFGGSKRSASTGNTSSSVSAYTSIVRAYAINHGWKGSNGKTVADKGKLSQDVVNRFAAEVNVTGPEYLAMTETAQNEFVNRVLPKPAVHATEEAIHAAMTTGSDQS